MSLSRTIDRLARVVRLEARRNPAFAARLEATLAAHASRAPNGAVFLDDDLEPAAPVASPPVAPAQPLLNPLAIAARDGADALARMLAEAGYDAPALLRLVAEHNLDPAGQTRDLDRDGLIAHIVAQAKRRAERDRKLFDY